MKEDKKIFLSKNIRMKCSIYLTLHISLECRTFTGVNLIVSIWIHSCIIIKKNSYRS